MFKGFQDTSRGAQFKGFPNLNHQMNNEAFGFSGCTFWLDAAQGLNTQTNLGAVSKWVDKIRGFSFEQATAGSQPRLITSLASYNNLPVVEFQSNARRMDSANYLNLGGCTIAIVANYNTLSSTANAILGDVSIGNGIALGGGLSGINGVSYREGSNIYISGTTESTSVKIIVMTESEVVVNGVQEATATYQFSNVNQLGSMNSVSSNSFQGYVGEILVFKTRMTFANCITLSGRLNSKYAIY